MERVQDLGGDGEGSAVGLRFGGGESNGDWLLELLEVLHEVVQLVVLLGEAFDDSICITIRSVSEALGS